MTVYDARMNQADTPSLTVTGSGTVRLPDGMTAEEAERLVREADEAQARKENRQ